MGTVILKEVTVMGKGNGSFALFCCFVALGVSAVLAFITYLLPLISSASISDDAINIMGIILNVSTLVGVSCGALAFAARRGKLIKLLTALFVLVFVVAIVLHVCAII